MCLHDVTVQRVTLQQIHQRGWADRKWLILSQRYDNRYICSIDTRNMTIGSLVEQNICSRSESHWRIHSAAMVDMPNIIYISNYPTGIRWHLALGIFHCFHPIGRCRCWLEENRLLFWIWKAQTMLSKPKIIECLWTSWSTWFWRDWTSPKWCCPPLECTPTHSPDVTEAFARCLLHHCWCAIVIIWRLRRFDWSRKDHGSL